MRVVMNYGKKGLPIDFPDEWDVHVIAKRPMPVLPDPIAAVRDAFANPVGSKTPRDEAAGCSSVCIAICDITRPVPNSVILPVLIKELIDAGIEPRAVTVLVATGLHRPNEGDELRELVGHDWLLVDLLAGREH